MRGEIRQPLAEAAKREPYITADSMTVSRALESTWMRPEAYGDESHVVIEGDDDMRYGDAYWEAASEALCE